MNAKTTTVTLVANGVAQDFEFSHAERLLGMRKNGGWHLPKDSKFEYRRDNGLQRRRDKKEDNGE